MTHNDLSARQFLDALDCRVAVLDRDGNITHVNEAWIRFSEESGALLSSTGVGVNYFAVCRARGATPEVEEIVSGIRAVIEGAIPRFRAEYACDTPNQNHWFELMTKPLPKPHDGAVVYHSDITDLRKARDEYAVILNGARGILWRARLPGFQTIFASKHVETILGYPVQAWTTQPDLWINRIHPEDREWVLAFTARAVEEGRNHDFEYRMIAADGQTVWLRNIVNVVVVNGCPREVVGISVDITERKVAELALSETNLALEKQAAVLQSREELLKIFVKNVPAGVAMFDREMRYLQASDRWCADYGLDSSQILGRSHYELFPDLPSRWKEIHRRALEGETLRAEEDRWDRADGGTQWIHWVVRPWMPLDGTPGGILIFAEDVTHRKLSEQALSDMTRKLIDSQEQERARIGRELHDDINQRLAMLSVEVEQLRENPSELERRLQEFRKQIAELSNDVQGLSHDLHSSKLEYLGAVAGIKSWCREFAERQKLIIDFTSTVPSPVPREIGVTLFRVLQEALQNAVKYSGAKRVEVQLREDSGEIHLIVCDSGKGFDVEAALRGKGLGLTSMQERVRLVGGRVMIDSRPLRGTTIHVRVPLATERGFQRAAG